MTKHQESTKSKIGFWVCCSLVCGNMIGSGIFLLPAALAPFGHYSLWGWLVTAAGALMTALVFVRLSQKMPFQGGPYRYALETFGQSSGFIVAWSYWISIWCGNAAISIAAVSYLSAIFPTLAESSLIGGLIAIAFVWLFTLVNIQGVRTAGIMQVITTLLKLIPLIALALALFFYFDWAQIQSLPTNNQQSLTPSQAIVSSAALTLWAFLGVESATVPADKVQSPRQTIPRATLIGFSIAAIIYFSTHLTLASVLTYDQLAQSNAPFADAAAVLWGSWAKWAIAIGAVISCLGALNGWIMMQGQIPLSAAQDGVFPKWLKCKSQQEELRGMSKNALVFASFAITVLVAANYSEGLVGLFSMAILMSTLAIFVPYLFSIAADLKQIWEAGLNKNRFAFIMSLLALVYCFWAMSGIGLKTFFWGLVLIALGFPVYLTAKLKQAN